MVLTGELREQVLAIYAAVDEAVARAGPRCEASGRCCRFTEYGHTLFLSHFEAELLLASAPDYDAPVSRDGCPFQVGQLCTTRPYRPIGCRVYFCDPAYTATGNAITEEAIAQLKRLAEAYGTGWRYAPLHVFLNEAACPTPADPARTDTIRAADASPRVALPIISNPEGFDHAAAGGAMVSARSASPEGAGLRPSRADPGAGGAGRLDDLDAEGAE